MKTRLVHQNGVRYLECLSAEPPIASERDAMDMIAAVFESGTRLLMLHEAALADDFFQLRTGLAGTVLQKLVNYRMIAALVLPGEERLVGRFREMALETNKGQVFRIFRTSAEAEDWLREKEGAAS